MCPRSHPRRSPSRAPRTRKSRGKHLARAGRCAPPARLKSQSCARASSASAAAYANTRRSFRSHADPQWGKDIDLTGVFDGSTACTEWRNEMDNEVLDRMTMALMGASPTDDEKMASLDNQPLVQILPDANVVKIGGQSFIDRGRAAVFPLIDEIIENLPRHKMIIGTGAGTRARHAYNVGLDLGVPTGVLSVLGFFVSIQNAKMIHYLLAKHGIPSIEPAQFAQLPLYLAERQACVCVGMPPYAYWQPNPALGRIPPPRTATACYLISELLRGTPMISILHV